MLYTSKKSVLFGKCLSLLLFVSCLLFGNASPLHANKIQDAKNKAVEKSLGSKTKNSNRRVPPHAAGTAGNVRPSAAGAVARGPNVASAAAAVATSLYRKPSKAGGAQSSNLPDPGRAVGRSAAQSVTRGKRRGTKPNFSRMELEAQLSEAEKDLTNKEKTTKRLKQKHKKIQRLYWSSWQEGFYLKLRSFVGFGGAYGLAFGAGYYDLAEGYHGQKPLEHLLTHMPETVGGFSKFIEHAASGNWEVMGRFLENLPPDGMMIGGSALLLTLSVFDKVRSGINYKMMPADKKLSGAYDNWKDALIKESKAFSKKIDIELELIGATN